jgi:N-acetylmuramoyl-L-alanine amidase
VSSSLKVPRFSLFLLTAATIALVLVGTVGPVGGQGNASPTLTILFREGRRALPLSVVNDQELVFLDDLASIFQLTVREESLGTVTVAYKDKTILLSDQPLASIAGRLVSLPSAPTRSGRRWLVPVEFINRAIGLVYDSRVDLRKPSRLVILGDLRVPRVTVRVDSGDPTRIVIETAPRTTSAVSQEASALAVKFDADALDAVVPPLQPQALVRAIRLVEPSTVAIDLGPRFMSFRAVTEPLDNSTRLTIDLLSAVREAQPASPPQTTQAAPAPEAPDISALNQPPSLRTVALDPGHGGEDEGVRGLNGTKEKDLALAVARKVKATIESRLGIRVLLTRDGDRNVSLNARAAMANNNKADLFISLHANASFSPAVTGASILYAAFDREAEQSAHASLGSVKLPTFGGGGQRDIDLVLWDLAQIRHIDRSAELSRFLEAEFKPRIPLATYPTERLPLSVLESANMPAVLVEMGYLSNADQEKRMAGNEFQNTVAQAVYDAVVKFRDMVQAGGAR